MIRRLLQRLHQFWFDGRENEHGADEELIGAYRFTRRRIRRLGMIEDPRVTREFDEIERNLRALQRNRSRR